MKEKDIVLFDNYLEEKLSQEERTIFENRLKDDSVLSQDFKVYSAIVIGICQEAQQSNRDFSAALKHLSTKQVLDIIGVH